MGEDLEGFTDARLGDPLLQMFEYAIVRGFNTQQEETKTGLFKAYREYCAERNIPGLGREGFFRSLYAACRNVTRYRPRVENGRAAYVKGIRIVTA